MKQQDLKRVAVQCVDKIVNGAFYQTPYKHLIVDDFLPIQLATECFQNFPSLDSNVWEHEVDEDIEVKHRTTWQSEFDIPDGIIDAVRILNDALILKAFTKVFHIKRLVPDPYFTGGGLNITTKCGLLGVHVDGNYHDATGLNRRMNALIYLNPGWQQSWGGDFGMYDNNGEKLVKKIAPIFNRLVVFDSHDKSFHGLPEPLNCPEDINRKSIILYYYTKEKRSCEQISVDSIHSALWVKRGLKDKNGNISRAKY